MARCALGGLSAFPSPLQLTSCPRPRPRPCSLDRHFAEANVAKGVLGVACPLDVVRSAHFWLGGWPALPAIDVTCPWSFCQVLHSTNGRCTSIFAQDAHGCTSRLEAGECAHRLERTVENHGLRNCEGCAVPASAHSLGSPSLFVICLVVSLSCCLLISFVCDRTRRFLPSSSLRSSALQITCRRRCCEMRSAVLFQRTP
jgi:hypothetical protein